MRSAAIRVLVLVILALGGVASSAAMAGAQLLDPIGTVTSAISTITSQTTVVSDLTGSVTSATSGGSGATGAVSGAIDSGADGGSGSASSGDASSGSATNSNRRSPHTRFDRLPRRYEGLLERIEAGRNVRANIARLRALLASASPQLRARVMRFIRLEIRRLERGGLTRRERAAVQRLRTLLTTLQGQASPPATQGPLSLGVEGSRILWATVSGGGVAAATAGSEPGSGRRPTSGRDEASSATPRMPPLLLLPSLDPAWHLAVLLFVLAAIACFVLLLTGPPRHLLPSPVRGMVEVRRPEVLALAVVIGLGLVMGLVTVLSVQAVLP